MRIGLISDTHSYLDERILHYLNGCDEIWHAGDVGEYRVIEELKKIAPLRAVYGNIDGQEIRIEYPKHLHFEVEGLKVYMTHIGGYPPRYNNWSYPEIQKHKPDLYIAGHSHIVKALPDKRLNLLHLNPGAAGIQGFHKVRTLMRFLIENKRPKDLEVIELGNRGGIKGK